MRTKNHTKKTKKSQQTQHWLYGKHACLAALKNPKRKNHKLLVTKNTYHSLPELESFEVDLEVVNSDKISTHTGESAVHQGIALLTSPLSNPAFQDINLQTAKSPILILDQITDPHNIGAILRSAAAFGVEYILVTDKNASPETGVMAKSASGALELVHIVRIGNLASAIASLKDAGFWCIGLDGYANETIESCLRYDKAVFIMGAEGKGMRQLTKKSCDLLVKLPISDRVESLNVSNAASIVLYEYQKRN